MVDGSTQCYYLDASRTQQGPATVSDLARLVRSGAITRDTMIWFAGMADWRPAGQVNELASLFGPSGPPSAPPPMRPPMGASNLGAAAARPGPGDNFGGYAPQGGGGYGGAAPPRSFMGAITTCFSKYVGFSGRGSRSEYWWWFLFQLIVLVIAAVLDTVIFGYPQALFYYVVALALFLPSLAAAARRLHDTDRSGWLLLLWLIPLVGFIIVIVFLCQRGTDGPNRFDVAST